jgi:branched-chain amino acid transport system permease protein
MKKAFIALVALVALAWPFIVTRYVVFLTTLILVNGIVAIGLNLLTGYTNQLSFGHAGFVAIGAYTAALLTVHAPALPMPLTLLLAGLVTALVGLALGIPCLRLEGLSLAMATLAFGFVVIEAILNLDWLTRGADGLRVPPPTLGSIPLSSERARYFLVASVTAVMVAAAASLVRTRTGRAFLAIRESEIAAQASGVDVARYKTVAFVVSAFYTGVAGGLFAFVVGFLSPDGFDVFVSVDYLVMVIVGGLASVPGSLIGAAVVTLLNDWLARFQNYRPLIFGTVMIAVMLFMPGGIASAVAGFRRLTDMGGSGRPPSPPLAARGAPAEP